MGAPQIKPEENADSAKGSESKVFEIGIDPADFGKADSLRYRILRWTLEQKYDEAINELKSFLEKDSEYPTFKEKVSRYINHSIDLIYAIKAKRNFPGIHSLTRAKQYELREKFKEHFKEMQNILKKVEKVETDLRIEDARSTIYVIRALWVAGLCLVLLWFILEFTRGLALTSSIVADDALSKSTDFIFDTLGL